MRKLPGLERWNYNLPRTLEIKVWDTMKIGFLHVKYKILEMRR